MSENSNSNYNSCENEEASPPTKPYFFSIISKFMETLNSKRPKEENVFL